MRARAVLIGGAAAVALVALIASVLFAHHARPGPTPVLADVVTPAADFETSGVANADLLPLQVRTLFTDVGHRHGSIRFLIVSGDGTVTMKVFDLTGRSSDGQVLKVAAREDPAIARNIDKMLTAVYSIPGTPAGRSELPGLQQVHLYGDTGPVVVLSPGIDIDPRDDARRLDFDTDPAAELSYLKSQDEEPAGLRGRQLLYVLLPAVGDQQPLGQPQRDYVIGFWRYLLGPNGAGADVTFLDGTSAPPLSKVHVATVRIPTPTIGPGSTKGNPTPAQSCTVPGPAYFKPFSPDFVNRGSVLQLLRPCAVKARTGQFTVQVEGHVALDIDGGTPAALQRGQRLALARAEAVVTVLEQLGVPAGAIDSVQGFNAQHILVQPPTDPANRAVVVKFTPK